MDHHSGVRTLHHPAELHGLLSLVLDRADPGAQGLGYRLVGTGAALLQGVHLVAGDVDLLVARREDVDVFAAALSGFPCGTRPVWLPGTQQYFTRFAIEGTHVEISTVEGPARADTAECAGSGPWENYVQVAVGRHLVPAVALELRLVTELVRNRPDRYLPLTDHMREHGADLPLVRRAMTDHAVAPRLQEHVLTRLRASQ